MEEKDKTDVAENDSFSSALNGILSNPEMMAMISSMANKFKSETTPKEEQLPVSPPPQADDNAEKSPAVPAMSEISNAMSALSPLFSGALQKGKEPDDKRACLLRALKPYLSKNRRDAIEHIITISKLSYLFKNLS